MVAKLVEKCTSHSKRVVSRTLEWIFNSKHNQKLYAALQNVQENDQKVIVKDLAKLRQLPPQKIEIEHPLQFLWDYCDRAVPRAKLSASVAGALFVAGLLGLTSKAAITGASVSSVESSQVKFLGMGLLVASVVVLTFVLYSLERHKEKTQQTGLERMD